jgi:hypothetical protein
MESAGKKYLVTPVALRSFWWSDEEVHPVRFDVHVRRSDGSTSSWCPYNPNLGAYVTYRTNYLTDKQTDLGWLLFNQ